MFTNLRPVIILAIDSLYLWQERDPELLWKLIESWHYRPLLSDFEAREVVRHVANQPL